MPDPAMPAEGSIYLDNAATSFPKPNSVYDAVDKYMRHNGAAIGRGSHSASDSVTRVVGQCRQRLAKILDAESSDRIAFTFNCTDSLNLLLRGVLRHGDRVVTTKLEHNSVLRPLHQLRSSHNVDVAQVDFDPESGLVNVNQLAEELSRQPTRLVVLNHASNVTGVVQPVAEVAALAHKHGALLLLDAAQTVGHLPFSVRDVKVDLLAAAGHKGLLGPLGTGILYVRDGLDGDIVATRSGGTGTASESIEQPVDMPTKFESGNMNAPGLAGLNAATEWLLENGIEDLHRRATEQTERLATVLQEICGVSVYGHNGGSINTGIASFTIKNLDSREAATIVEQSFGIQCRAGLHCAPLVHEVLGTAASGGTLRFSVGPFTTDQHINAAVSAVNEIAQSFAV
ncbi:aminotransferase class V-fold PLP-dependent enzyme [Fuerstiella marisgermanici]|uniref:cysteine desulfurase n=1 Tax=Fuerstiella marisgermanici TaxID=1891926 RepID=A0A1P8WJA8_9PLAN|nr:aminotransferase class V-fold PLP-dependent enzyme [Fuerstiella marisgermanici]APZ94131.1 putative cysteine desulfurase [Fuerstiella marisgermanici]